MPAVPRPTRRRPRRRLLASLVAVGAALALGSALAPAPALAAPGGGPRADTGPYAPLHRTSPALQEPVEPLRAALRCNGRLRGAYVGEPVLLVPGTFSTPEQNYGFNYLRAFEQTGRAYCTVDIPNATTGDAQIGGERIAHALRTMHRITGKKIDVLGFSQGGLLPRFAFRFFPDTRKLVDDFVALSPTNRGTVAAGVACVVPACQPGVLQQRPRSAFLRATNSGKQTFSALDYTVVFTRTDEVATPNLTNEGTSALRRDSRADLVNVAIQDICPADVSEHVLIGTVNPVAYALVVDAFDHPGVARPDRIDRLVCLQGVLPGVDPVAAPLQIAAFLADIATNFAVQPRVVAEPALRSYTRRR